MLRFDRRTSLRVCLVAENCLAEAYLRHVLSEHPQLHPIRLKQYLRLSPLQRIKTVFIVDLCGLEVPLYECLGELRARCSNAKFLLLGNEKSRDEIVRLLIMGVQGYIPYPAVPRALFRAIFSLAANQWWVPHEAFQDFLREAASALRNDGRARSTVTPREDQILELVRRRLSNREIASRLQIQVSTVKFHLSNILSKMYVSSRRELIEIPSGHVWRTLSS
jgi:two-component system, NarL family, response regulator LiaR